MLHLDLPDEEKDFFILSLFILSWNRPDRIEAYSAVKSFLGHANYAYAKEITLRNFHFAHLFNS